jgi:hypothetical protein
MYSFYDFLVEKLASLCLKSVIEFLKVHSFNALFLSLLQFIKNDLFTIQHESTLENIFEALF